MTNKPSKKTEPDSLSLEQLNELAAAGLLDDKPELARRRIAMHFDRERERDAAEEMARANAQLEAQRKAPIIIEHYATVEPTGPSNIALILVTSAACADSRGHLCTIEQPPGPNAPERPRHLRWLLDPTKSSIHFVPGEIEDEIRRRHRNAINSGALIVAPVSEVDNLRALMDKHLTERNVWAGLLDGYFKNVVDKCRSVAFLARWRAALKSGGFSSGRYDALLMEMLPHSGAFHTAKDAEPPFDVDLSEPPHATADKWRAFLQEHEAKQAAEAARKSQRQRRVIRIFDKPEATEQPKGAA